VDNILLWTVLSVVVLTLLFLFWRTGKQDKPAPSIAQPAPPVAVTLPTDAEIPTPPVAVVVEPVKTTPIEPLPVVSLVPVSPSPPPSIKVEQKQPKARPASKKTSSPVRSVVTMLKKPGSLVTAFVLREILDKPLSLRRKHPRRSCGH
jgi:type IV secretory pathway VirB10-like protein